MKVIETDLPGVLIIEPRVFKDDRGSFLETFQKQSYEEAGIATDFVQDNLSYSTKNTLRGLHFQNPKGQAKLVQVIQGAVYDVAVDIRVGSPTFGRWVGVELSEQNHRQMYISQGFAHGFVVLSEKAIFSYKCSNFYSPEDEGGIIFSDAGINVDWPGGDFVLSPKDKTYPCLSDIDPQSLPKYNE